MTILIAMLLIHFVGDFLCQSDWMAQNKSTRWEALALHVTVYTGCFAVWAVATLGNTPAAAQFVALTFASHFLTDAVTSRINKRLWDAKQVHWFFVGIGADQWIHALTLSATLAWVTPGA